MLSRAVLLLGASAVVLAETDHRGKPGSGAWIKDFDNLVAFGDSYTDESRLSYFINHNGTAPPTGTLLPESNNTAGGGITWARWVNLYTGAKLYDYAVSGAVCSNSIINRYLAAIYGPFPDVDYEVEAFVADTRYINASTNTNTLYTNRRADNTVYSMWIGTNDLGVNGFLTDSSLNGSTIPDYVDCIYDRFDEIYAAGGRYFVLMNTAPLQLSPLYGMPGEGGLTASHYWPDKPSNISEVSGKMKQYTQTINALFAYRTPFEVLIAKRYPGASIALFDVNAFLTHVIAHPAGYLDQPTNVTGQYYLCDVATGSVCKEGKGKGRFFWYDELHPGEMTDRAIAREFVGVVGGRSAWASYW